MNLRRRRKRKTARALDAAASVTKLWSEWQIGKHAAKGVAKVKDVRPPSKLKRVLSLKWVRIGGVAAVAGGAAAAITRKLKSDDPADYTGPPPSVAAEAAAPPPETPPPLAVAPDPATQERDTEPASGAPALRKNRDDTSENAPDDPELVGDDAAEAALDPTIENPGAGAVEVRATFAAAAADADSGDDSAATPDDEGSDDSADSAATPDGEGATAATADPEP